jgi:hypothetical protein
VEQVIPMMVTKGMKLHVLPLLEFATIVSYGFGLWMSKGGVDTFALVINFLNET